MPFPLPNRHDYSRDNGFCRTCGRSWTFPDAPHTEEGQEMARRFWGVHMEESNQSTREHFVRLLGETEVARREELLRELLRH